MLDRQARIALPHTVTTLHRHMVNGNMKMIMSNMRKMSMLNPRNCKKKQPVSIKPAGLQCPPTSSTNKITTAYNVSCCSS